MNKESKPLRMRAFRVIDRQGGKYSHFIVTEDVERALFQVGSSSFGGGYTEEMQALIDRSLERRQAEIDRNDAWNVLQDLREYARFPENDFDEPAADSIDAAVSQREMRFQERMGQVIHGKIPTSVPSDPEPTSKGSETIIVAVPGGSSSEEDGEQMIKEVWDFAGGKRLEWKPIGNTPSGRKCEVLTFDGSEEVMVGPSCIEIPTRFK